MTGSTEAINKHDSADGGAVVQVESRELRSPEREIEEEEWGRPTGLGVPMTDIRRDRKAEVGDRGRVEENFEV